MNKIAGVAACHIGGITLHQFAGIGRGEATLEHCYTMASKPVKAQIWRRCKHLIIDEISMIDGKYFEVRIFHNLFKIVRTKTSCSRKSKPSLAECAKMTNLSAASISYFAVIFSNFPLSESLRKTKQETRKT